MGAFVCCTPWTSITPSTFTTNVVCGLSFSRSGLIELRASQYSQFGHGFPIIQIKIMSFAGLSTLWNNPGNSRLWIVSPGLQIRL